MEHHLAQQKAHNLVNGTNYIDNLGNLYLISKSANSRLSDRDVKEKVRDYSSANMGPNRQIIYKITEANNYEWDEMNIRDHYNDLLDLINKRESILFP